MEGLFNRRYLRVKVMQAVYAYDSANHDLQQGEKSHPRVLQNRKSP